MSFSIPSNLRRLQQRMFVTDAELGAVGRDELIRFCAGELAEAMVHDIAAKCVTSDSYMDYKGQALAIDVFVLSPAELNVLLANALMQGHRDASRWNVGDFSKPPE